MKFSFLQDENGDNSSKRLFGMFLMASFIIYVFVNLFTGRALKPSLEEYLFYLIVVVYLGVAAEGWRDIFKKFPKQDSSTTVTKEKETTEIKKTE